MNRNYNDPQYKQWRQNIKKRDHHTCQWPGCSSKKKLNVHHIYRWSDFPGLRYHPNNGITLCRFHHDNIKGLEDSYSQFFSQIILNKGKLK